MIISCIIAVSVLPIFDFATNALNARLAIASPPKCLERFVDYRANAGRDKFDPNPNFCLKGADFSCASPWNSGGGSTRAGTLISKRHIIFAKHFPLWKGVRIVFTDQKGAVCPLRILATRQIADSDIMIGLLDYEVTPNIRPAKILPENFAEYIGDGKGLPVVTFNQGEEASISQIGYITTNRVKNVSSTNAKWSEFGRMLATGDSGNPAFLLVGNEPILLYCLLSGGVGNGPSIHRYRREIQAAMDELCPGYKLECFDFSTVGK